VSREDPHGSAADNAASAETSRDTPDTRRRSFADARHDRRVSRWERRRQKIREEIERNRRGENKIPTWVLVVALLVVIAGWAALIFWPN
jgi:hypothetical protein